MKEELKESEGKVGKQFFYYKEMNYIVHPVEGLILNDEALISRQRKLAFELVKKFSMTLLKGENILKISLPVGIFAKLSLLERIAGEFAYAPIFLQRAALSKDPIERMKHCVAFAISTFHLQILQEKPFNPILGETIQRSCGDCNIYCEQVSHHPPVCSLLITATHFSVTGSFEYEVCVAPNSSKTKRKQKANILFDDGTKIEITQPPMHITGIMFGRRGLHFEDCFTIADEANSVFAVVKTNADEPGFFRRLFSAKRKRKDYFLGYITRKKELRSQDHYDAGMKACTNKEGLLVDGYWIDYLKIDNKIYWKLDEQEPLPLSPVKLNLLPSDSIYREDLVYLKEGKIDLAQEWKDKLENIQRGDRTLRDEAAKSQKKK